MNLTDIPLDDPKTFQLLSEGRTLGVFQLENRGMRSLLLRVRPSRLADISAVLALYRPGPLASGSHTDYARRKAAGDYEAKVHPGVDPTLTRLLRETYGLIVYQEQVMQIVAAVTGWDYARSNDIFNAMRKKQLDKMEKSKPAFMADSSRIDFSPESIEALWGVLVPFSDYSFNQSHSVAYAHISYWTAYLKANYPTEFMTELLSQAKKIEDVGAISDECRQMGIKLLPPDLNASSQSFTPTKEGIRYGLQSIKGVGESATALLVAGRPYSSLDDFFRRADTRVLNAGVLEALVKSGVFDSVWQWREELATQARDIAAMATQNRRLGAEGNSPLFAVRYRPHRTAAGPPPKDSRLRGEWERQTLGIIVTRPEIILTLDRELAEVEWIWVKEVLASQPPHQKVTARYHDTEFTLGLSGNAPQLRETLKLMGVGVEEK